MKKAFACFMALFVFILIAASPSFQNFLTTQFGTSNSQIGIKSGVRITNISHFGDADFNDATLANDMQLLMGASTVTFWDGVNSRSWMIFTNNNSASVLDTYWPNRTNFIAQGEIKAGTRLITSMVEVTNTFGTNMVRIRTTNGNFITISGTPIVLSYTGTGGAANTNVSIDASAGSDYILLATNNIFLSIVNMAIGQHLSVDIVQDGTGNRLLTLNGAQWRTNSQGQPFLSTAANAQDVLSVKVGPFGTNAQWVLNKNL